MRLLLLLAIWLTAVASLAADIQAGPYRLKLVTDPAIVPIGKATLLIDVQDSEGNPISGARVVTLTGMPGMFMGEREQVAVPDSARPGRYTATGQFPMAGAYEVKVSIEGSLGTASVAILVDTGASTADSSSTGMPWKSILIGIAILALLGFVAWRMVGSGQRVNAQPLFSAQVLGSLLLLGAAIAVSVYAVNNWRRKGAMTPIEAQVMDMSAPPPDSPAPVVLATVERKSFTASVRYAGQAVGFVEQDVVPRVTGAIEWMGVYVGDRVAKGQLLVRLDTSQVEPEVAAKGAAVSTAESGVSVASMEHQTALAEAAEAEASVSSAEGAVEEAKANLDAVEQGKPGADAQVESAEADVQIAQEEVEAAAADNAYWQQQLERSKSLLDSGYISRERYQRDAAEAAKAQARLHHSQEQVRRMRAQVGVAQAAARRATSEIAVARRRIQQAESQLRAMQAKLRAARSKVAVARQRIGQAQAGVREAQAGLRGTATTQGYAGLRSEVDGVVTQRLISPGVVVQPGQAILRIAQTQPIRIQANVAEGDLSRLSVGARASITTRDGKGLRVMARLTSVAPSVDPMSRTGLVEAVLPNRDEAFVPGQFVSMEIGAGSAEGASLVVPSAAIQRETAGRGMQSFVWIAEPVQGQPDRFTVSKAMVETSGASGDSVGVRSGLSAGQRVVVQGASSLRAGQVVSAQAPAVAASQARTVVVTDRGYEPQRISLDAGRATTVTFVRKSAASCGEDIVFPALGITRKLPLNVPVSIEIPAQKSGELAFACGMDMMRGKAVVR